jgi:cytochrome d ubiquinol oxidase subunit II
MGISRPVSFKYRSKLPGDIWRRVWDWVVFIGGFFPSVIFGVLVGNIMQGLPFYFDADLRVYYSGTIMQLFNPFALFCGLLSLMMLVMHGGLYLAVKTEAPIRDRAIRFAKIAALLVVLLFAIGGVWVKHSLVGYMVMSDVNPYGFSNPMHKNVAPQVGAWLLNYTRYPMMIVLPIMGMAGAIGACLLARVGSGRLAFVCSGLSLAGIISTFGASMFPFILPSSNNLAAGLLVWDASSSYITLVTMLIAVIIFLPLILIYTAWVYRVLRGKVTRGQIEGHSNHGTY